MCIAFQCVRPLWFGQESNAGLIMSALMVCVCVCVRQYQCVMGSVSCVALGDSQRREDVGRACGVEPTDSSRRKESLCVRE